MVLSIIIIIIIIIIPVLWPGQDGITECGVDPEWDGWAATSPHVYMSSETVYINGSV